MHRLIPIFIEEIGWVFPRFDEDSHVIGVSKWQAIRHTIDHKLDAEHQK